MASLCMTMAKSSKIQHEFGLMDQCQDYCIYAYMTERAVFSATPKNLAYVLFLYVLLLAAIHMLWWRTERSYEKNASAHSRNTPGCSKARTHS